MVFELKSEKVPDQIVVANGKWQTTVPNVLVFTSLASEPKQQRGCITYCNASSVRNTRCCIYDAIQLKIRLDYQISTKLGIQTSRMPLTRCHRPHRARCRSSGRSAPSSETACSAVCAQSGRRCRASRDAPPFRPSTGPARAPWLQSVVALLSDVATPSTAGASGWTD